jgi:F-type H+-transporting ATPase subunit a
VSGLLANPKVFTAVIAVGIVFFVSVYGGALGAEFGGGFLGSPLASIELKAEPVSADPLVGGYVITNTMITTWIAILVLGLVSYLGTRRIKEVPGRLQGFLEVVLGFFIDITESVAGPEKARRFFPLVVTIFLFIVTSNWLGILPGFGTIGRFEPAEELIHHKEAVAEKAGDELDLDKVKLQIFEGSGAVALLPFGSVDSVATGHDYEEKVGEGQRAGVLVPFLRSANTDINTPMAMALVAMFMVHFWGFSVLGVFGHLGKFLNFKEGPIGLFVGLLEIVIELARIISFTFRLFGNIFAGEVLLIAMAFLIPLIGLVPFLGLELFVGLIQAFIFAMLTLVFATTATISHGGDEH